MSTMTTSKGEHGDEMQASGIASEAGANDGKTAVGMVCAEKSLYQKVDMNNMATWVTYIPDDFEEAAEDDETEKYALLIRYKKSSDSRNRLEVDSIVIQSPLLKNVLHGVLEDYPGVTTSLSRLIFSAPFRPLVHRRHKIIAALDYEGDEETKRHLQLLKNFIFKELKDVVAASEDYTKYNVVTYEHIWTIFHPGCIVFASRQTKPTALRVVDGLFIKHEKLGPCFQLKCERVDWDGSRFGYGVSQQYIMPFEGTTPITDLDCFPLSYHPDEEGIKEKLVARGRQFEMLAGYHYKSYKGRAIQNARFGEQSVTVNDRIIIDAAAHGKANPHLRQWLKPLDRARVSINVQAQDVDETWSDHGTEYDEEGTEATATSIKNLRPLKEEELLICTPLVRGYALRTSLWLEFFVDSISDVVFNDNAFDSLVLPEGHKSLILAIAEAQVKKKNAFDDVIAGKGRGVIMLLTGSPGIGKTLTAESVADRMQVPLYMLSAGDLGARPEDIETRLTRTLELMAKWKAVLLLDECDVFLEARSAHDLQRNQIVSIFLRKLEYYEGLLFLTTNRVKNMDEAFNSRIHFRLAYPDLDARARRLVWRGLLDRQSDGDGDGHDVRDEDLDKLEKLQVNGRVIKNILRSAALLASHKDEKMKFEHIQTVFEFHGHDN